MTVQSGYWAITAFLFGITIGSFLNAVIYRLARPGLSLLEPRHSICPNCKNTLSAIDLVPLFSFLFLGRRCRQCKVPISWRYFNIELLTGLLYTALYLRFPHHSDLPNLIALLAFTTVLIPAAFIDLEKFLIPDSLNILAFLIPLARDVWGIVNHEPGHAPWGGWLPVSIAGALIGILIFGAVRVVGSLVYGKEAMGLGDVFLARGMGAMLVSVALPDMHALSLFPLWVLFACLSGIIVGPALIYLRTRAAQALPDVAILIDDELPVEERPTLGGELKAIAEVVFLFDIVQYIRFQLHPELFQVEEEDDFTPAPSAIPFGPFLVLGFLAAVFVGEPLTLWYIAYAWPKHPQQ